VGERRAAGVSSCRSSTRSPCRSPGKKNQRNRGSACACTEFSRMNDTDAFSNGLKLTFFGLGVLCAAIAVVVFTVPAIFKIHGGPLVWPFVVIFAIVLGGVAFGALTKREVAEASAQRERERRATSAATSTIANPEL
jgi:hypothetical protein